MHSHRSLQCRWQWFWTWIRSVLCWPIQQHDSFYLWKNLNIVISDLKWAEQTVCCQAKRSQECRLYRSPTNLVRSHLRRWLIHSFLFCHQRIPPKSTDRFSILYSVINCEEEEELGECYWILNVLFCLFYLALHCFSRWLFREILRGLDECPCCIQH